MAGILPAVAYFWKSTWTVAQYEQQSRGVGTEKQHSFRGGLQSPQGKGVGKSIYRPLLFCQIRNERRSYRWRNARNMPKVKSSPVPGAVGMTLTVRRLPTRESASPVDWSSP
ncbi:MAG: hypothetical protein FJ004_06420 [Chloroflexi bacterium]|nr:hypothetical protein [Chloroflexota bacterium]